MAVMAQATSMQCGGAPLPEGSRPAVVMWDLNAQDAACSRAFYGQLFGWEIGQPSSDRVQLATVACGEGGIGGVIGQAPSGDDPSDPVGGRHTGLILYVKVHDIAACLDAVERLGGKRVWGPHEVAPGLVIAQFEDPDGQRFGLTT